MNDKREKSDEGGKNLTPERVITILWPRALKHTWATNVSIYKIMKRRTYVVWVSDMLSTSYSRMEPCTGKSYSWWINYARSGTTSWLASRQTWQWVILMMSNGIDNEPRPFGLRGAGEATTNASTVIHELSFSMIWCSCIVDLESGWKKEFPKVERPSHITSPMRKEMQENVDGEWYNTVEIANRGAWKPWISQHGWSIILYAVPSTGKQY